jgi:multiple sugar transport system ATP-binding protein
MTIDDKAGMSELTFQSIGKTFGSVPALLDFTLSVPNGCFLVLLGPSGSGKTTALRIAAGLEEPTSGRLTMGGRDITNALPRQRDMAMVFQSYALYPHMTVAENIGYPLRVRKQRNGAERIREVAASLEVDHLLERKPRQLSGGQRQRVALARAIIRDPSCFLLDEPLSNLDAKLRLSARTHIKRLQKQLGTTTIYVTHDQVEAMTMGDLITVMHEGVVQQVAPPREVYRRPANRFVATFLGTPPLCVLPVAPQTDAGALAVAGQPVPFPEPIRAACAQQAAVEIGIRPEDLRLVEPGTAGALDGTVYVVEPLGNETLVEVELPEGRVMVRAMGEWAAPIGSAVGVAFEPEAACFFDGAGVTVVHRSDGPAPD